VFVLENSVFWNTVVFRARLAQITSGCGVERVVKKRTTIRKATPRIIGSWEASHQGNTLDLVKIYLRIEIA
jgi:hypothetical protein